jgi:hypothetical protein
MAGASRIKQNLGRVSKARRENENLFVVFCPQAGGADRADGTFLIRGRKGIFMSTKPDKPPTLEDFLTRDEFRVRFDAEAVKVQRHYCTLFRFWRTCRLKLCQKERACHGDARECVKLAFDRVPRQQRFDARRQLLQTTPRNLGAPERAARDIMAGDFWVLRNGDIPRGWMRAGRRRRNSRRGAAR